MIFILEAIHNVGTTFEKNNEILSILEGVFYAQKKNQVGGVSPNIF
jgi:hypothetical protein